MPKIGDTINLGAQLEAKDTSGFFIRARVFEPDGDEITGSPVTLSHENDGFYINQALIMPDFERVHAVLETFEDAFFAVKSTKYPVPQTESFIKDELNSVIDDLLDAVVRSDMVAEIPDEQDIIGLVNDSEEISATIDDSDLVAQLDESVEISGTIDDSDIVAEIED